MTRNLQTDVGTADAPPGSLHPVVRRRWLYEVTDWNDDSAYMDENGEEVCRDDAKEHVATDAEAAIESDRRADLWETKQDALAARVTRHSQGIGRESPNAKLNESPPRPKPSSAPSNK